VVDLLFFSWVTLGSPLFSLSAKDDIDLDALAAEIEGAGAAREQEPQKAKGKKKKGEKKTRLWVSRF